MKALFKSALAVKLAEAASSVVGTNPLVRLGAAGLATRIAAASVPAALVAIGAVTAWKRYQSSDKTASSSKRSSKPRQRSAKKASPRAPAAAA